MKRQSVSHIPRDKAWLQFTSRSLGEDRYQVDYELVLPLGEVDCRGTFDHDGKAQSPKSHRMVWLDKNNCYRIPLGRTNVETGNAKYPFNKWDDSIDLPFRDGAHASWDRKKFGDIKLYYVVGENIYELAKEDAK